jgi:hypothetical protein
LLIFLIKVLGGFFYPRSEKVSTGIEKNSDLKPPAIMFFAALGTWFNQDTWRDSRLKGGGLLNIFLIGGNVEEGKAYRLIPLTPPPRSFYNM